MRRRVDTKRLTTPTARLLGAALLVGALVAGCGGASPHPTTATTSAGTGTANGTEASSNSTSPPSAAQMHQQELAFAKCMRASGVPNFPDPAPGGSGFYTGAGIDPASPAFRAAQAKCRKLIPGGGPPSQTHPSTQTLARFRTIARCMRQHGVPDFPDPRTSVPSDPFGSGAGVISDIEEVIFVFPSTIDQQSPAFTQAATACAFPLHNH